MNIAQLEYMLEDLCRPGTMVEELDIDTLAVAAEANYRINDVVYRDDSELVDAHIEFVRAADAIALHAIVTNDNDLYQRCSLALGAANRFIDSRNPFKVRVDS